MNPTAYIISYDLKNPGRNYQLIISQIKSFGTWAKIGNYAYVIVSKETASTIRDRLHVHLESNDQLYVGALATPAAWSGMSDQVTAWLRKHLSK